MSGNAVVKNGTLLHFSDSQTKTHTLCPARYFYQKVMKLPEPEDPEGAAAFGGRCHRGMEGFYQDGTTPDTTDVIGRYVKRILDFTPPPGPTIESETSIQGYVQAAGVPAKGYIDLLDHSDGDLIHLWDLKTRGSFERNHTEDSLARDHQLILYSRYANARFGRGPVKLTHLYVKTEPKRHGQEGFVPKVVPVTTTVTPEEIDAIFFEVITPAVEALKVTVAAKSVDEVKKNTSACYAFGKPCPYLERCQGSISPSQRLSSFFPSSNPSSTEVPAMSLAEKLQSGTKAPTTQAPSSSTDLHLFLDCLPVKGDGAGTFTRLEDYIAPYAQAVAAEFGVTDVREVKFSEATSKLIGQIKRNPPTGVVIASSVGLSGTVAEALRSMASSVTVSAR